MPYQERSDWGLLVIFVILKLTDRDFECEIERL